METDTTAEVARLQKEISELKAQLQAHHMTLMGDGATTGIVMRLRDVERIQGERVKDFTLDLAEIRGNINEVSQAMLGDLTSHKPGLLSIVAGHDKLLSTITRLAWVLVGALLSLGLAQIWQAVLAYQALTLVQK